MTDFVLDEAAMRLELERLCAATSQKEVAERFGFSPSYINDVLRGRRAFSGDLAQWFGYRRVVIFIKTAE